MCDCRIIVCDNFACKQDKSSMSDLIKFELRVYVHHIEYILGGFLGIYVFLCFNMMTFEYQYVRVKSQSHIPDFYCRP